MTDETRKKLREEANTHASYFEDQHKNDARQSFMDGGTSGYNLGFSAGKREGRREAIEEMIAIHKSVIDRAKKRRDEALESPLELDTDLAITMACTITNEEESIKKLEKLRDENT